MKVFAKVVDEGSFAAAARVMNISPSVVTKLIADLEERLGTRLLNRTTRKQALTTAGAVYLERLRFILQEIDDAEQLTQAQSQDTSGVLKVLTTPVLANHALAPFIAQFRVKFPKIHLDIELSSRLSESTEDHDLILMPTDEGFNGNVVARRILTSDNILVASPQYLKYRGIPREPLELSDHCVLTLKVSGRNPRVWNLVNADNETERESLRLEPVLMANNSDTLLMAAIDHVGITSVAIDLVRTELSEGRLTRVLPPWIAGRTHLYAAYPSRKFIPKRTTLFVDFITQSIQARLLDS
jgi:DNA-binding transcriptional LysR family regulator